MKFLLLLFSVAWQCIVAGEVLDYARSHLPSCGTLKNSEKFVYVDVDDAYIHELIPLIAKEGFEEPPYFDGGLVGAHISVIYPEEMKAYGPIEVEECGEPISFTLESCQIVRPLRLQRIDEVYLIVVKAPRLDEIRTKYSLPPREYEFHITIGVKPKMARSA